MRRLELSARSRAEAAPLQRREARHKKRAGRTLPGGRGGKDREEEEEAEEEEEEAEEDVAYNTQAQKHTSEDLIGSVSNAKVE